LLVEGVARVLPAFREDLSRSALKQLQSMGIEVRTGTMVKEVTNHGVTVNGEFIPCRTVIWAAGNAAAPIGKSLSAETDRAGRVIVNEDLTVPGHPEVFAIGDMAFFPACKVSSWQHFIISIKARWQRLAGTRRLPTSSLFASADIWLG
jgi:NADH dehydrogenase